MRTWPSRSRLLRSQPLRVIFTSGPQGGNYAVSFQSFRHVSADLVVTIVQKGVCLRFDPTRFPRIAKYEQIGSYRIFARCVDCLNNSFRRGFRTRNEEVDGVIVASVPCKLYARTVADPMAVEKVANIFPKKRSLMVSMA
jgi:hypothetical protein